MRNTLIVGLLLLGAANLTGCSKSTDTAKPAENPVTTFLSDQAPALTKVGIRENSFRESGVVFSSSVAGKLTQVGSKLPDAGIYTVTLWDFDTKQILRQKTVEQEVPDKLALVDIDLLPLTMSKKYLITINNRSGLRTQGAYTSAFKASGGNVLPTTKGSITMHGSRSNGGSTVAFPTDALNELSTLNGFPEFTFIPD